MKPLASTALVLGFAVLLAAPAEAAKLPPGSYQQSCRNAYVDSSSGKARLFAECPDRQGNMHHSGVQFMKCSGDIANLNGELGCVQGASAGQNTGGQNNGPGGGLPAGSWQQSCRDPQLNGTMLTATCLRGSGGSGYSSIDTRACGGGPVGNQNGQLYCEGGQPSNQGNANAPGSPGTEQGAGGGQGNMGGGQQGNSGQGNAGQGNAGQGNAGNNQGDQGNGGGQGNAAGQGAPDASASGMPAGSWQQTCRGPHLSESVLTANCQRRDGAYRYSALDLSSCEGGPVGNDNGRLVCESAAQGGGNAAPGNAGQDDGGNANAGGAPALPPGSWQQSCTNGKMAGSLLTASCQRSDGGSRFSAVDVATCPGGRVGNFEGSLACE